MNIHAMLGFLSVGAIVMSYAYLGVDDISAVQEVENTSIGVSQTIEIEKVSQNNDDASASTSTNTNTINYDALANIGTLQERIDLYNYFTSHEYIQSISEKIVYEDGRVGYRMPSDAEYYPKRVLHLENGETIEFIEYVDKKDNLVRLQSDGNVTPLVGEKYNQYYVDQLQNYCKVLDEINQELGTDYNFDFELSTFEEAEQSVDMYKLMSLDEFRTYMTNSIKETENLCGNAQ